MPRSRGTIPKPRAKRSAPVGAPPTPAPVTAPGPARVGDLAPAPFNPRTISDARLISLERAMRKFGDLSGLVFNRRTKRMVGGHQRTKNLPADAPIVITHRLEAPDAQGTVALGYVDANGERWTYREVDWDDATEKAANIAANEHGGEWDMPMLTELIADLDAHGFDVTLSGFDDEALRKMFATPAGSAGSNSVAQSLGDVQFQIVVSCSDEHAQAALCADLEAKGFKCRLLAL